MNKRPAFLAKRISLGFKNHVDMFEELNFWGDETQIVGPRNLKVEQRCTRDAEAQRVRRKKRNLRLKRAGGCK